MRILILTQHYAPETPGTARRAVMLAKALLSRGHQVRVLCGSPNHPSMQAVFGSVPLGASLEDGISVTRVPVFRPGLTFTRTLAGAHRLSRTARALRTLTYVSWLVAGALETLLKEQSADVLLAISPLPTGLIGALSSRFRRIPLVLDLQDIWPDALARAGLLTEPNLLGMLERLEAWTYAQCAALVVLSEGFRQQLLQRGIAPERLHVIPNGVDPEPFGRAREQHAESATLRTEMVVAYTGNLGYMQDLDCLLDAAAALKHVPSIRFLLVGEGVDRVRLERRVADEALSSVSFLPHQPVERIPRLLLDADVCFLALRPGAITPGTVPSKLYEYLMAGRPVINLVEGDAAEILDAAEAGFNVAPGDVAALRVALFSLYADPGMRVRMGTSGQRWVHGCASQAAIGARYEAVLKQVSSQEGSLAPGGPA